MGCEEYNHILNKEETDAVWMNTPALEGIYNTGGTDLIQGIHHIAIIVSAESSVDFYKKLGFQETFRKTRNYDTVVLLSAYGFELEIFVDPNHPERATKPENIGLRHVSLKVDSIEDTVEELKDGGLELGEVNIMTDWGGKRFCYITDPDGLPVELHE